MPLTEISVRVTGKNIKDAKKHGGPYLCPISLALHDRGFFAYITRKCAVTYRQIDWSLYQIFTLPEVAQEFVRNFDAGNPVQPIEFTLERNMDEEA